MNKANWSVIYQPKMQIKCLNLSLKFSLEYCKTRATKNVFIRNDKSCFARSQTLLKEKNKELQKECDSSLESKHFETIFELIQKLFCSFNNDFNKFYRSLVMSSKNCRKRWNLMNEIRNSARTRTQIHNLKNIFNDYVTELKKIANLLNYRFSQLRKFIISDETYEYIDDFAGRSIKIFSMRCTTEFECLQCIDNSTIPEILKTADATPIYKKNDPEEPDNYRPISIISITP